MEPELSIAVANDAISVCAVAADREKSITWLRYVS
jgi:hypothetical protein